MRARLNWDSGTPLARGLQFLSFAIPDLLYYLTACRTPGWVDATLIVSDVTRLTLSSWVNSHNLFNLLGFLWLKLFPSGNIHFYLVLLSALFGAVAVYFIFRTVLELTSNLLSAGFAALALAVSHSLWWHSTMVEVYTLNSAILAVMLFFIIRYDRTGRPGWLFAAAFSWGLGCCNHLQMGLYAASFLALVIFKLVRPQPRVGAQLALAVAFFLAGLAFYLFLFGRDVREAMAWQGSGAQLRQAFRTTFDDATGREFKQLMFARGMPPQLGRFWRLNFLFWVAYNYPSPAIAMALFGLWAFWRKRPFRLSLCFFIPALLVQALWSANYFVWDMYAFVQHVFVLLALPIGLAAEWLLRRARAPRATLLALLALTILLPAFIYSRMPSWSRSVGFLRRFFDSYPQLSWTKHTWDPVGYVTNPMKRRYDKVERYAQAVFALLPQGAHFLNSDSRSDYPLRFYYRDLYGIRTDLVHHALFSPFFTIPEARREAVQLKQLLEGGEDVYSASILYPEKVVLDQLFLLYRPSRSLESLQELTEEEYVRAFPAVALEKIVLFPEEQIWIYRLTPRQH